MFLKISAPWLWNVPEKTRFRTILILPTDTHTHTLSQSLSFRKDRISKVTQCSVKEASESHNFSYVSRNNLIRGTHTQLYTWIFQWERKASQGLEMTLLSLFYLLMCLLAWVSDSFLGILVQYNSLNMWHRINILFMFILGSRNTFYNVELPLAWCWRKPVAGKLQANEGWISLFFPHVIYHLAQQPISILASE